MDFNLPKFFPPNFLQSLFAKVFTAKVSYYTVSIFVTSVILSILIFHVMLSCSFHTGYQSLATPINDTDYVPRPYTSRDWGQH